MNTDMIASSFEIAVRFSTWFCVAAQSATDDGLFECRRIDDGRHASPPLNAPCPGADDML